MEGVCAHLRQNIVRMCKTISDSNTLKACQETTILFRLNDLLCDRWHVFTSVTLAENN